MSGKNYIIDLSEQHAAEFNKALAPYIEHARRARRAPANKRKSRSSSEAARVKRQKNAEIRAWALENGVTVSKRGQLGQDTIVSQPIHVASPVYIYVYPLYITDVPGEVMYTGTN